MCDGKLAPLEGQEGLCGLMKCAVSVVTMIVTPHEMVHLKLLHLILRNFLKTYSF